MCRVALPLLALLALRVDVSAQCRGDVNENGRTDITDAIAVVSEILNGCSAAATPTPTEPLPTATMEAARCPHDFETHRYDTEDHPCAYRGTLKDCAGTIDDGVALWRNVLGGYVFAVAQGAGGPVGVLATRQHERRSLIESVFLGRDLEEEYSASGEMSLESDPQGLYFRADAGSAPCRIFFFSGDSTGTIDTTADSGSDAISLEAARAALLTQLRSR